MILIILLYVFKGKRNFLIDSLFRFKWFLVLFSVVSTAVFIFNPAVAQQGERTLGLARRQVEKSGAYSFSADIQQTLIPRPVVGMIGETSPQVDMTLPVTAELQLRFEGEGVNPQPLLFQQEGQNSYLLEDGERIRIDNPTWWLIIAMGLGVEEIESGRPDFSAAFGRNNGVYLGQFGR
jgi:hypothetical protein